MSVAATEGGAVPDEGGAAVESPHTPPPREIPSEETELDWGIRNLGPTNERELYKYAHTIMWMSGYRRPGGGGWPMGAFGVCFDLLWYTIMPKHIIYSPDSFITNYWRLIFVLVDQYAVANWQYQGTRRPGRTYGGKYHTGHYDEYGPRPPPTNTKAFWQPLYTVIGLENNATDPKDEIPPRLPDGDKLRELLVKNDVSLPREFRDTQDRKSYLDPNFLETKAGIDKLTEQHVVKASNKEPFEDVMKVHSQSAELCRHGTTQKLNVSGAFNNAGFFAVIDLAHLKVWLTIDRWAANNSKDIEAVVKDVIDKILGEDTGDIDPMWLELDQSRTKWNHQQQLTFEDVVRTFAGPRRTGSEFVGYPGALDPIGWKERGSPSNRLRAYKLLGDMIDHRNDFYHTPNGCKYSNVRYHDMEKWLKACMNLMSELNPAPRVLAHDYEEYAWCFNQFDAPFRVEMAWGDKYTPSPPPPPAHMQGVPATPPQATIPTQRSISAPNRIQTREASACIRQLLMCRPYNEDTDMIIAALPAHLQPLASRSKTTSVSSTPRSTLGF